MFSSRAAIGEGALKMMLSDASGSNDAVSFGDDSEDVETLPIPESIVEASFGSDVLEASSAFTPLEISDDGILGEGEHDDDAYPEESQSDAASDLDIDRMSVVEGTIVYIRVDLGGRRKLQKNKDKYIR